MELINRSLVMRHEHLACALVEQREIAKTPSGADGALHDPPEAFERVEVVPTMGWEEVEAPRAVVVVEGRVERMRPVDPAAVDDHHHFFASCAADCHHVMEILPQLLGIKVRHNFIEDFRSAILDGTDDIEHHAARDATPRAVRHPRLPFATFFLCALALAQRACGQAIPLGAAPPAQPGQGKAPHDRVVFIEQDDLTSACLVLQGGESKRAIGESSWGGLEPSHGTAVAERVFFQTPRTLSRPSWTPGSRASDVKV
jgi:hypothetical protein